MNNLCSIRTTMYARKIIIELHERITFVSGNSGVGKTFLFNQLQLLATTSDYAFIKCFNSLTPDFVTTVGRYADNEANLIVIDNGDVLISNEVRLAILMGRATFLIFSRNYYGLALSRKSVAILSTRDNEFSLVFPLVR